MNAERKTKNALRGRRIWEGSRREGADFLARFKAGGMRLTMGSELSDEHTVHEEEGLGASVSVVK